jgi:DNA-binding Xre family transcriptional regulator
MERLVSDMAGEAARVAVEHRGLRLRYNKSAMAARMRRSRAAVHRLLDPKNTSVTLATLNRAARSLGCKVKIEFVPA